MKYSVIEIKILKHSWTYHLALSNLNILPLFAADIFKRNKKLQIQLIPLCIPSSQSPPFRSGNNFYLEGNVWFI